MKHVKKLSSLLLALVMILSMATTVFAANENEHTITITNDTTGHVYEAYQIFKGDWAEGETDTGILSNVEWGAGVNSAALLEDLVKLDAYKDCKTAADVAEVLKEFGDNSAEIKAFSEIAADHLTAVVAGTSAEGTSPYSIKVKGDGYYLIQDAAASEPEAGASYTNYILQVVGNVNVEAKDAVVESNKKVDDKNDSNTTEDATEWEDSADYDIGDMVPFKLTGTVPANYDSYTEYYYVFHDTESDGLTFDADSVKVYVDDALITSGYAVVTDTADECTFEIVFADLKQIPAVKANSVITVEYQSVLNENANIGSLGNPNVMHLEYSNNPNWEGDGKEETGKTVEDKVIVFTYEAIVNKVDENGDALEGAGFTLYKKNADGSYTAVGDERKGEALTTFTWTGLDDGEYKLVETTTPAGYNTIEDIYFTIEATHDELSAAPELKTLVVKDSEGNTISAEGDEYATFRVTMTKGQVETDVENKAGATLPETGGVGTTMFYALGSILILAAVVLLVTKRRMNTAE